MNLRSAFPYFAKSDAAVYLDSAATTQKPRALVDALRLHYENGAANVHRGGYALAHAVTTQFEAARAQVAQYLNACSAAEIIWTRSATESLNLLAYSLGQSLKAGDAVLVSELEHHANILPWQQLCARRDARLRVLPIRDDGALDLEQLPRLLDERVKIVAISAMSNVLGSVSDLKTITAAAHAVGALVVIDAAQAIVHAPLDVQALDCDFLVFSAHKLYGPSGLGVLYGKYVLLDALPPWQCGGEMISSVNWARSEFQKPPLRFEAGTPPIEQVLGFAAALQFVQQQDRAAIRQQEFALLKKMEDGLGALPRLRRYSCAENRAAIASFAIDGLHVQDVAAELDARDICLRSGQLCAQPLLQRLRVPGLLRASLAMYSNEQDVERLLRALDDILSPAQMSVTSTVSAAFDLRKLRATRGWEARQRLLMQWGDATEKLTEADKIQAHAVAGCSSRTWLIVRRHGDVLHFVVDSDARIVRGLAAVVLALVNGKTAAQILQTDIAAELETLGLHKQLSPSRSNGLHAIMLRILELCRSVVL